MQNTRRKGLFSLLHPQSKVHEGLARHGMLSFDALGLITYPFEARIPPVGLQLDTGFRV